MKIERIMLDRERTLKFGARAFIAMEKALGVPIAKADFESVETIYAMLYGALVHEDRKLTFDKVIDIVDDMIDSKLEENEDMDFQEAFEEVMNYIGEKVGKVMNPKGVESLPKK